MTEKLVKNTILFLFCLIFIPSFAFGSEEKGFFYNQELQSFLSSTIEVSHGSIKADLQAKQYSEWKPALRLKPGYTSEIENIFYCQEEVSNTKICDLVSPLENINHPKKGAEVFVQKEKIKKDIKELAADLESEPQNGKFKMSEEGKLLVVEKSKPGYELDAAETATAIVEAMGTGNTEIEFALKEKEPEISTDNIESLGIKELIGHGESNFAGSPKNRIHNIHVATARFDGLVMAPNEEFSFTSILGPVEEETGYKKELVIKDNKTIPEFGGGVCQVSTTMFRTALNSGFEITERTNHAYPVQYYSPQGTDATIYLPKPDLKFVNNTPGYVLIQAGFDGTKLSFDVYGTSDRRDVEIDGPYVTERTPDGGLRTVLYQNVKDSSGTFILKDIFKSFYENPDKFHEPQFTQKPKDWSNKQWDAYKAEHGL